MILKVFAVYDSKSLAYMQPFYSNAAGGAIRAFGDAASDGKSPISLHPGDYQLYELGTFDDNSGMLTAVVPMKLLANGADYGKPPVMEVSNG